MARKITIEFNDKTYIIEYNRKAVAKLFAEINDKKSALDGVDSSILMIKYGLLKNHSNDLPDDDTICGWVLQLGDSAEQFVKTLQELIQEVLQTVQSEQKQGNLKWGVEK